MKKSIWQTKNKCKNMDVWRNKAHSGNDSNDAGGYSMVRAVLRGSWKCRHSQNTRNPWIVFMESSTL